MTRRVVTPEARGRRAAAWLFATTIAGLLLGRFVPDELMLATLAFLAVVLAVGAGPRALADKRLPPVLLLFVAWLVLSWLWSADRGGSVRALFDLVTATTIGVVVGTLLDAERGRRAVTTVFKLVVAANVVALVVAPGWSTRPPAGDPVAGWHALFGHKNGFGAFLVLAAALLLCEAGRRRFWWLLVVSILLVGSQSASSIGVSLVLLAVVLWRSTLMGMEQAYVRAAARLLSVMLLGLGTALAVTAPNLVTSTFGRSATFTGRTEIWAAVERQIGSNSVLGLGWGGVWRPESLPTQQIWREARFQAFYAHNGYLDMVLQVGAVGMVLFLVLMVGTVRRLLRPPHRGHALWGVLLLLGLALQAITESGPFTGTISLLFISFLATMAAQHPRRRLPPVGAAVARTRAAVPHRRTARVPVDA